MTFSEKKKLVTDHAIARYLERDTGSHKLRMVLNGIIDDVNSGIEVKPRNPAMKLMNHGYKIRRYIRKGTNIYVQSEDGVIVTVLKWSKRLFIKS